MSKYITPKIFKSGIISNARYFSGNELPGKNLKRYSVQSRMFSVDDCGIELSNIVYGTRQDGKPLPILKNIVMLRGLFFKKPLSILNENFNIVNDYFKMINLDMFHRQELEQPVDFLPDENTIFIYGRKQNFYDGRSHFVYELYRLKNA